MLLPEGFVDFELLSAISPSYLRNIEGFYMICQFNISHQFVADLPT